MAQAEGPVHIAQPPLRSTREGRRPTRCGVYDAMRESDELEPLLLARAPADAVGPHGDNPFAAVTGEPGQYLLGTDEEAYDKFFMTAHDRSIYTEHLAGFLRTHRPTSCTSSTRCSSATTVISTVRQVLRNVPDRPHAARVSADLQPLRPAGAHPQPGAVPGGFAAALPRVLSGHRPAAVLPAQALHPVALRAGRPVHRSQPVPARALRRLGNPTRANPCTRTTGSSR